MEASVEFPAIDSYWELEWTGDAAEAGAATAVDSDHLFLSLGNSYFDDFFSSEFVPKLGESDPGLLGAQTSSHDLNGVNVPHHGSKPKRKSGDHSSTSGRSTSGEKQRPHKKKARSARFSEAQRAALQSWLHSNMSNPYPTEQDKRGLSEKTGLTTKQVEAWFSRTRRRALESRLKKAQLSAFCSQEQSHRDPLSPLERYLSESPDVEPVEEGAMANLINQSTMNATNNLWSTQHDSRHVPSTQSHVNGGYASSVHSISSTASTSSFASFGPRKGRRRHFTAQTPKLPTKSNTLRGLLDRAAGFGGQASNNDEDLFPMAAQASGPNVPQALLSPFSCHRNKPYQCIFCFKGFRKMYEWRRHMESTHSPAREWVCLAPQLMVDESMIDQCFFCQRGHADFQEFDAHHRASSCLEKCQADRTFFRKDNLMQHVRATHCDKMTAEEKKTLDLTLWSVPGPSNGNTACGFCGIILNDYDTRTRHIAKHFEKGEDMTSWKAYDLLDANLGDRKTSGHWSCMYLLAFAHGQYPQTPCLFCTESAGEHFPSELDREIHWAVAHNAYDCPHIAIGFVSVEEFKEHLVKEHNCKVVPELALLVYFCSGTSFVDDLVDEKPW